MRSHRHITLVFVLLTVLLATATAGCNLVSSAASAVKGIVGIDDDGQTKAFGFIAVVNEPDQPRASNASPGVAFAEDLVRLPFFGLVECNDNGQLSAYKWYQYVQSRSYTGDLHLTSQRVLTVTNDKGDRVPVPCTTWGPTLASYSDISDILTRVYQAPDKVDAQTVLAAQTLYLGLRGFYTPGESSVTPSVSFTILARLAQADDNSRAPDYSKIQAKLAAMDVDFNPCRKDHAASKLGARIVGWTAANFRCKDLGSGQLFGFEPNPSQKTYRQTKDDISTEIAATHRLIYGDVTVNSTGYDQLWNLASNNDTWQHVAGAGGPTAALAGYLTGAGGLDWNQTFAGQTYGPVKADGNFILPKIFDHDAFLAPASPAGLSLAGTRQTYVVRPRRPPLGPGRFTNDLATPTGASEVQAGGGVYQEGAAVRDNWTGQDEAFWAKLDRARQSGSLTPGAVIPGTGDLKFSGQISNGNQYFTDARGNTAIVDPTGNVQTWARMGNSTDAIRTDVPHQQGAGGDVLLGVVQHANKSSETAYFKTTAAGDRETSVGVDFGTRVQNGSLLMTQTGAETLTTGYVTAQGRLLDRADAALARGDCRTAGQLLNDARQNQALMDTQERRQSWQDADRRDNGRLSGQTNAVDQRLAALQRVFGGTRCGGRLPAMPRDRASLRLDDAGGAGDDANCDATGTAAGTDTGAGNTTGTAAGQGTDAAAGTSTSSAAGNAADGTSTGSAAGNAADGTSTNAAAGNAASGTDSATGAPAANSSGVGTAAADGTTTAAAAGAGAGGTPGSNGTSTNSAAGNDAGPAGPAVEKTPFSTAGAANTSPAGTDASAGARQVDDGQADKGVKALTGNGNDAAPAASAGTDTQTAAADNPTPVVTDTQSGSTADQSGGDQQPPVTSTDTQSGDTP